MKVKKIYFTIALIKKVLSLINKLKKIYYQIVKQIIFNLIDNCEILFISKFIKLLIVLIQHKSQLS